MSAKIVSVDEKYRGWARFLVATVRLPDGSTIDRVVEDHGSAACVLPYDPLRRMTIVVRQLRAPVLYTAKQQNFLEAVAGLIDGGEAAETTARREAMEEAGLRLTTLDHVTTAWAMPGISTERMDLYLGEYSQGDRVAAGGGIDDENEAIEVVEMPLAEVAAMADDGRLADMKTLLLVQTLRLRRPELFR